MLATRSVTVSPSFQRSVGAGTEPFTVSAMRGRPVKFIGVSPMRRSNSVPDSVVQRAGGLPCANADVPPQPEAGERAAGGESLDERASRNPVTAS